MLLSYVVYAAAQSYVARPDLQGGGMLQEWVRFVYRFDKPYNDFPSLHTSVSSIIARYWLQTHHQSGYVVTTWCALIIASTVLIHQHYIADVAGGLLTAAIAIVGADYLVRRLNRTETAPAD